MPKMLFVNLPVTDLAAATRFYEAIGFEKNDQFSNEQASSMVWSEAIIFQLMTRDYYQTFTSKPIADARETSAALFALSRDSRDEVDAMVEAAAKVGGTADIREAQDMGFMYLRSFADPDGNVFEPAWMDMSAMAGA
ncbi:VOC family protein [Sphingomonas sp. UNC305MFCol5.2]|uniref:VOC family protein n=1 Tax=Sphingomonas sp. UNC305MFCol5.2 TaxID=1449076 RepID=UPI0004102C31|nr:VOC family protein [Sphingomonas sp. UNC305MFCol5.2]